jgi:hypothetical protein
VSALQVLARVKSALDNVLKVNANTKAKHVVSPSIAPVSANPCCAAARPRRRSNCSRTQPSARRPSSTSSVTPLLPS